MPRHIVFLDAPSIGKLNQYDQEGPDKAAYHWNEEFVGPQDIDELSKSETSKFKSQLSKDSRRSINLAANSVTYSLLSQQDFKAASQKLSKLQYAEQADTQRESQEAQSLSYDDLWTVAQEAEYSNASSTSYDSLLNESFLLRDSQRKNRDASLQHDKASASYADEESSWASTSSGDMTRANIPEYGFNLHNLSVLSNVLRQFAQGDQKQPQKISFLAAVLEVEGPIAIQLKSGNSKDPLIPESVAMVKYILGDGNGSIVKLTAWRETAEALCGQDAAKQQMKKGDVVYLKDVLLVNDPPSQSLVASPRLKSVHQICFRSLPTIPADARFTPDLTLGLSDLRVRLVARMAQWVLEEAGIA